MSFFNKKNKKDATSPSFGNSKKSLPSIQTTPNKIYRKTSGGLGGGSAGPGGGGTSAVGDLSTLSPSSYAQQFDDLDAVVASATPVKNNRGSSTGKDRAQTMASPSSGGLAKEMQGLKLDAYITKTNAGDGGGKPPSKPLANAGLLDFDNDSDGVFEDDDGMMPSDSNHG
eukprot:CAMPEP_0183729484 /NCGR_PEP_ID=MMETSP0737-20130205/30438_1 /TAXON_ID=385413 /ORGANISM="Thalassiosira miniscula, Strain CCMP1093" /LENGTH=169 /DNA_ID=CAMNT_0025961683 /DNA_START=454 /DNA_END=960 /DNA_ORIENTATION=-